LTPSAPPSPLAPSPPQRHTTCQNDEIIRPSSTEELSAAIKEAVAHAAAAGRPLKMRTTHEGFGTIQSFPCAIQPTTPWASTAFDPNNATRPYVAGILMDKMTKVLSFDTPGNKMRVQAQMPLKQFFQEATKVGLSPPRSSLPWWQGLTLGGIYSTSSHGSGLNTTSMIVSALTGRRRGQCGRARGSPRLARPPLLPLLLPLRLDRPLTPTAPPYPHPRLTPPPVRLGVRGDLGRLQGRGPPQPQGQPRGGRAVRRHRPVWRHHRV
jgi:hypothetical protein